MMDSFLYDGNSNITEGAEEKQPVSSSSTPIFRPPSAQKIIALGRFSRQATISPHPSQSQTYASSQSWPVIQQSQSQAYPHVRPKFMLPSYQAARTYATTQQSLNFVYPRSFPKPTYYFPQNAKGYAHTIHTVESLHEYYSDAKWSAEATEDVVPIDIQMAPETSRDWELLLLPWIHFVRDHAVGLPQLYSLVTSIRQQHTKLSLFWTKFYYWMKHFRAHRDEQKPISDALVALHASSEKEWWEWTYKHFFNVDEIPNAILVRVESEVSSKVATKLYLELMSPAFEEEETEGDGNCLYYSLLRIPRSKHNKECIQKVQKLKILLVRHIKSVMLNKNEEYTNQVCYEAAQGLAELESLQYYLTPPTYQEYLHALECIEKEQDPKVIQSHYLRILDIYCDLVLQRRIFGNGLMLRAFLSLTQRPIAIICCRSDFERSKQKYVHKSYIAMMDPDYRSFERRSPTKEPLFLINYDNRHFTFLRRVETPE